MNNSIERDQIDYRITFGECGGDINVNTNYKYAK